MAYTKQPLSVGELIELLKSRGMTFTDETFAQQQLGIVSYFRLAGYFRPMETDKTTHIFKAGTTFEQVLHLYSFDMGFPSDWHQEPLWA